MGIVDKGMQNAYLQENGGDKFCCSQSKPQFPSCTDLTFVSPGYDDEMLASNWIVCLYARCTESLRLEKTSEIIQSSCPPTLPTNHIRQRHTDPSLDHLHRRCSRRLPGQPVSVHRCSF